MEKIPTLLLRTDDRRSITNQVNPACAWVLEGEGHATRKWDGVAIRIEHPTDLTIRGYARRAVAAGKTAPPGFVPVATDETTGKVFGWEPIDQSGFAKFYDEAITNWAEGRAENDWAPPEGTYELVGPKIQQNPEHLDRHQLVSHAGAEVITLDAAGVRWRPVDVADARATVLRLHEDHGWEGIVWHHPDGRMAKLKAKDFR